MAAKITEIAVDSADPGRLAEFWCAALGYEVTDREEGLVTIAAPGTDIDAVGPVAPVLTFAAVPENKAGKNRWHLDLSPERDQREEEARLIALGARRADVGQGDVRWIVMQDPEGNEFCVLRTPRP